MLAAFCVLLFFVSATLSLELDLPPTPIVVGKTFSIHWQRQLGGANNSVNSFTVTLKDIQNEQPGTLSPWLRQVGDTDGTSGELEFTFNVAGPFAFVAVERNPDSSPKVLFTTDTFQVEPPQQQPDSTSSRPASTPTTSSNSSSSANQSDQSTKIPSSSVSTIQTEALPGIPTTSSIDAGTTQTSEMGIPTDTSDIAPAPSSSEAAGHPTDAVNAAAKSSKTGKIVGAVLGSLACLAALAGLLFLLQRRRASRYSDVSFNRDMMVRSPADTLLTTKYAPVDALAPSPPRSELISIDDWDTSQQRHGV